MFLIDNLLLAPGKAIFFLLKEMAKKAQEEFLDDDSVKQELQEIYALYESGKLTEQEFEAREVRLVERLQQIARAKLQENWGSSDAPPEAAMPVIDTVPEVVEEPALPEPEAPAASEVSFNAIAASLAPLLEMAGARADRPGPQVDAGLHMRPLTDVMEALGPAFNLDPVDHVRRPALPPPPPAPPAPPPPTPLPVADQATDHGPLTINQVIDRAVGGLSVLRLRVSAITSVARAEDGWRVSAELVERRGVPDSSDLLGLYELQMDQAGNILQWERTRMRRRCDLGR